MRPTAFSNPYGDYGSKYNSYSACNVTASDPPVIVDERGGYYGELTVSQSRTERTRSETLQGWIAGVCQSE